MLKKQTGRDQFFRQRFFNKKLTSNLSPDRHDNKLFLWTKTSEMSGTLKYPWNHSKRYNDFSTHFRSMFEGRVQKISVNAGFTCPNRDGSRGLGGCTYCNNKTFQPSYCDMDNLLKTQLEEGIAFFSRKYSSMRYLAYFQSYTNTYAPLEILSWSDVGLSMPIFRGILSGLYAVFLLMLFVVAHASQTPRANTAVEHAAPTPVR